MLFPPGARPDDGAVRELAEASPGFAISHDPGGGEGRGDGPAGAGDWLELLANGLTFDLVGLAPGRTAPSPVAGNAVGLPAGFDPVGMQAITLQPGPHLAAGGAMLPVVRSLAWLAARLADLPGTRAVAWHPARSWCDPAHFRDSVLRWIDGGVFPGLSLASLTPMPDGGMQSQGLALFTGQELRLEPDVADDRAAGAKIALRVMHWLVESGAVENEERLAVFDGRTLRLAPSDNGRFVRVWRG